MISSFKKFFHFLFFLKVYSRHSKWNFVSHDASKYSRKTSTEKPKEGSFHRIVLFLSAENFQRIYVFLEDRFTIEASQDVHEKDLIFRREFFSAQFVDKIKIVCKFFAPYRSNQTTRIFFRSFCFTSSVFMSSFVTRGYFTRKQGGNTAPSSESSFSFLVSLTLLHVFSLRLSAFVWSLWRFFSVSHTVADSNSQLSCSLG